MSFYLTGKALLVMSARPWQDGPPLSDLGGESYRRSLPGGLGVDPGPGRPGLRCGGYLQTPGLEEQRAREGCFEWGDGSGHLQSPHREGTPCSVPIAKSSKNWKARGLLNWSVAHLSQLDPGAQSRMETNGHSNTASGPWGCHSK